MNQSNQSITLSVPAGIQAATVSVPGSKSFSNRCLLLAALTSGSTEINGILLSKDSQLMAAALRDMGVDVSELNSSSVTVKGNGTLKAPSQALHVGNAGTAARFLTAACCLVGEEFTIDGDEDMRKRPINPLLDSLNEIGFSCKSETGCLPVTFTGQTTDTLASTVEIDSSLSSQYISALMMIAPLLPNGLTIKVKDNGRIDAYGYIVMTMDIMEDFGITVEEQSHGVWKVPAGEYKRDKPYSVEPDYSACTYIWAANALSDKSIQIEGRDDGDTRQPDAAAIEFIKQFPNMPAVVDGSQMQDAVPTLAVLAAFNSTPVRFTGIENLRVKECDRIEAVHEGLNNLLAGLASIEKDDLIVNSQPTLGDKSGESFIRTFNDHRIAMAFAVASIRVNGIQIENPDCVGKTFPGFWNEIAKFGIEAS